MFVLTDLKQGSATSGNNALPNGYRYLGTYAAPTLIRGSLTKTGCKVALGETVDLYQTEVGVTVILVASSAAETFGMDALVTGGDELVGASSYV